MSKENLEEFCRLVLRDPALQEQLKNIADREEFIARVIEFGLAAGVSFSHDEIQLKMRENRRLWRERWI